ncbi:TIGR04211 family SH3 domain-containing protein [Halomonas piscis]|uniref:TIGR04211 family SH3 domain-containing protein n=1 Tax=Halomonas piscis TaxID=3031727 RepID=A0ABY9YXI2_9GAMM|nr:TIGR04211 family SH3 domain-containing protein [Halomonas piscis]WNK19283.1 TIGR04211 family SH3 domain-containing protein [Halomonas piscis]
MQATTFRFSCRAALIGLLIGLGSGQVLAQESAAWVSEELTTYVRSGPTDGYRIVGTLSAGEKVEVLETSGKYTRVESQSGDTVWILSDELQDTPSAREKLPRLETRVAELTEELDSINATWEERVATMKQNLDTRAQRIDELEARNDELEREADTMRKQSRKLNARLETQEEDLLMRYFMYGGGVAGAGLLVGLIVPHLPRRRKRRDRWF